MRVTNAPCTKGASTSRTRGFSFVSTLLLPPLPAQPCCACLFDFIRRSYSPPHLPAAKSPPTSKPLIFSGQMRRYLSLAFSAALWYTSPGMAARSKKAATEFAAKWGKAAGDEKQDSARFWLGLLGNVLGMRHPSDAVRFKVRVNVEGSVSFIDAYLPETRVIIVQKSADADLDAASAQPDGAVLTPYRQAKRYSDYLPYDRSARWIVTCNFREIRVHDMNAEGPEKPAVVLTVAELPAQTHLLRFLTDADNSRAEREKGISEQAGELIDRIYSALLAQYPQAPDDATLRVLTRFCVRLVFCLYAEDAGLFAEGQFLKYLRSASTPDAKRRLLSALFRALDLPPAHRDPSDATLLAFPYVNGGLFAGVDADSVPPLNRELCVLIEGKASAEFNWRDISPTIFAGLFESALNPETRCSGGMRYTSAENIHKVIDPLFLDDLKDELTGILVSTHDSAATRAKRLRAFCTKLASLTFLDPACGSGNFLTETYISLRRLENKALSCLTDASGALGNELSRVRVSVRQFYGIEINDFAAAVAETTLRIASAQMWRETRDFSDRELRDFLPLENYDNIRVGNALTLNWLENLPNHHADYIIGHPPFAGFRSRSREQGTDINHVRGNEQCAGFPDYACCWFKKAADVIQADSSTRAAFVSTDSIVQGDMAPLLWKYILAEKKCHIDFAFRPFRWLNGAETVTPKQHYVIVGMTSQKPTCCTIFDTSSIPHRAAHINEYLIDAPCVFIERRTHPLCDVPGINKGNQPTDRGNLILDTGEYADFIAEEPRAAEFIRPYMGADEFINNKKRYCLWLQDVPPDVLRSMPLVMRRLEKVRAFRLKSSKWSTRRYADSPALFQERRQPLSPFIAMPDVSTSRRTYIPVRLLPADIIPSNKLYVISDDSLYLFGILSSLMHAAWMRTVTGRLGMGYQYSGGIVYNNFPWPESTEIQRELIEARAQTVLDVRSNYPNSTLARLYDSQLMPPDLRRAHKALDVAVDTAYGRKFTDEASRVAHLFSLYERLTSRENF